MNTNRHYIHSYHHQINLKIQFFFVFFFHKFKIFQNKSELNIKIMKQTTKFDTKYRFNMRCYFKIFNIFGTNKNHYLYIHIVVVIKHKMIELF